MPFTFKLSKRLARIRWGVILAAAATLACDAADRLLSDDAYPSRPNFSTTTGLPASITDLAVIAVSDSSATLSFTEVDDGISQPAKYGIRYLPGTISWGSATDVASGTCATPVEGTAIGSKRSCTVLGLSSSTAYEFQVVPFRGTLDVDAVFGGLSNVASGTTGGASLPPPPPPPPPGGVDTVFAEGFESGNLAAWEDGANPSLHRVITDASLAQSGSRLLEVTYPAGTDGGWLTHWFMPGYDSLYASFWVRFPTTWQGGTKLLAFYGSRTDNQWSAMGQAGNCPNGTDFFAAMVVSTPAGAGTKFYSYYPAMAREPDGVTCWGRSGNGNETYFPPLTMSLGAWHHIEFWVKLNAPGSSDAVQTFWVDGVERATWGGLSFRSSSILRLNSVQLTFSNSASTTQTQKLYVDNLVVLTSRPGP